VERSISREVHLIDVRPTFNEHGCCFSIREP
jgi:hypothetical protein